MIPGNGVKDLRFVCWDLQQWGNPGGIPDVGIEQVVLETSSLVIFPVIHAGAFPPTCPVQRGLWILSADLSNA